MGPYFNSHAEWITSSLSKQVGSSLGEYGSDLTGLTSWKFKNTADCTGFVLFDLLLFAFFS